MPFYTGQDNAGTTQYTLQDFEPSFGSKLNAAVRESWLESYGPVATDWWNSRGDDGTPKLTGAEAKSVLDESGLKGLKITAADGQYTRAQLDVLLDRQRALQAAKDVRERTPWDAGSVIRGGAMFAAGIVDPINLATAFVPWTKSVGALRAATAATMAESFAARTAGRAAIGAVDAGISTAVLEPFNYAARQSIGDDYSAFDAMANIAFGTAFGGGIHVLGGAAGDVLARARGKETGRERFAGLSVEDIQYVQRLQEEIRKGMPQEDVNRTLATFSPEMRRAAGFPDEAARAGMPEVTRAAETPETQPFESARPRAMSALVTDHGDGVISANIGVLSSAFGRAVGNEFRLEAIDAGEGDTPALIERLANEAIDRDLTLTIDAEATPLTDAVIADLEARGLTVTRTDAQALATQEAAANATPADTVVATPAYVIERGPNYQVPVETAADVAATVGPQTREALLRASVAQSVDGRNVDVDAIAGLDPSRETNTLRDATTAADRNLQPEQQAVADFDAAAAVQARLDNAPRWQTLEDAEAQLAEVDALLADTVRAGDDAYKYAREQGETREARPLAGAEIPLYARGIPADQAVQVITEAVRRSFGGSTDKMLGAGRIRIVARVEDLPEGPHPGDVQAATAPDGTVWVIARNVSEREIPGIVLHEIGVHVGMENMLGAETFQSILKQLDEAVARGEKWAQSSRSMVPQDTPAHLVREEQLAYLVQYHPEVGIVKRLIAAIREWAYRTFEFARNNITLNPADLQAMALSALRAAAKDEGGPAMTSGGIRYTGAGDADAAKARILRKQEARARKAGDMERAETLSAQATEAEARAKESADYAAKQPEATGEAIETAQVHRAPGPHNGVSIADYRGALDGDGLPSDAESIAALRAAQGNPNAAVKVYRAGPPEATGLRAGDWVSPSRQYAEQHGEAIYGAGNFKVIESTEHAADLFTDGNSVNEWGYAPQDAGGTGGGMRYAKPAKDEPPLAPGMTRLYHGSAEHGRYEGKAWFSTDRKYAENYRGKAAELQYVDIPTERANALVDPDNYGQTIEKGHTLNVELDANETGPRKPLIQKPVLSRGEIPEPAKPADELRPFDERIARAKQYGKVLRAAADKLENDAQSVQAMKAAMPDLTNEEIADLLAGLRKQVQGLRSVTRSVREAMGAENVVNDLQDDAMRAADSLANNLHMAAVIEKRNAALNMNARLKANAFLNQFRTNKLDFEGFRGLLVGTERKRVGGRLSIDAEQKSYRGAWLGGMTADLEKAGLMGAFASGQFDRDAYIALYRLGKGQDTAGLSPEAVQIAQIVNKYQEDARNTRNRFGAWIRDLNGYITRQSHDMYKIRDAGMDKFKQTVLPLLDLDRTLRDFQGSADDFLTRVYDDFSTGSHMRTPTGEDDNVAFGRGASLARKESSSRVLYFKDGEAAYQYNAAFGQGKLAESVLGGLDSAARSAALLKILGTNPEAAVTRLFDEYAESLRGDPARRSKFLSKRGELDNLLKHVDGRANIPGDATMAKVASATRAWISMSRLGGMLISSITDLSNYAAELRFGQGRNLLGGTLDGIGALVQGRAKDEKKAILSSLGVFHESTLGSVFARFDNPDLIGGKMAAAMQQFFKFSGINWWTESLRDGYALTHSHYLAENSGRAWAGLPDALRDMLSLYNIDAGKWDVLRAAPLTAADGRNYMAPEGLKTVPRETLEAYIQSVGRTVSDASVQNLRDDLAQALRTMTIDRAHHAVIEPGARTRAFMLRGTQPGTATGELWRFVTQFKSFPVALIQMTLGREIYGRGYDTIGQYIRQGKGDMVGLATFLALSTAMGYAAMSVKDLLRGKNPRPVDNWTTWQAAMVQGGGLGIYGDFLFGKFNRMGGSLTSSLVGPTLGVLDTVADLWTRVRNGDDAAAATFNAALSNTPFLNLFYTRAALDYLFLHSIQEALNPGYLRRSESRIQRENEQTFYLPPSQASLRPFQ